jgi:hypothetical protein
MYSSFLLVFVLASSLLAQTGKSCPSVSKVFAVLTRSLDSKIAKADDEVNLRTLNDVIVDGVVVIPSGSRVIGHVAEIKDKAKSAQSALAIVIDSAITKDEMKIPLQAIIAAIAAPQDDSLSSDATYGMMHSNEPKMVGGRPLATSSSGELPASSKASSNAAVATANLKGPMDALRLDEDSQGAMGYEGVSLSWRLAAPPPVTIIASKKKSMKLLAETQMLLRMAPPRLPK